MGALIPADLPHPPGAEEANRGTPANIGGLASRLPAGAQIRSSWRGDRLELGVAAIGQQVEASLDVHETLVRVTVQLPPALAFFGKAIEAGLRRGGPDLLEDRSGKR